MLLFQASGLFFWFIAGAYFLKIQLKKKTLNDDHLRKILRKGGIYGAIGAVLTFNAFRINSKHNVLDKTKAYG